jgi:hypothetical protein
VNDESLVAILAAVLAVGKKEPPEDFFDDAAYLLAASRRYVARSKETTRLKIDFEVESGVTRAGKV